MNRFYRTKGTRCQRVPFSSYRLLAMLSMLVVFLPGAVPEKQDYILIEWPRQLVIYNKYEQQMPPSDLYTLRSFQPMQILEEKGMLSDNFTPCMRVKIGGLIFYIIREADGKFRNEEEAGYVEIYRGCVEVEGAATVLRDDAIYFSKRPTSRSIAAAEKRFLSAGESFEQLINYNGYTLVALEGGTYGWTQLPRTERGRSWAAAEDGRVESQGFPVTVIRDIQAQVNSINSILSALFSHFARGTSAGASPRWETRIDEQLITCTLTGSPSADAFEESTQYLVNYIESVVLGTGYSVTANDTVISIVKKKQSNNPR